MDPNLKDWLQAGSWIAASVGVLVTALKFWSELRRGREQREQELRWKQAAVGKDLNDEMLSDPESKAALHMLDYPAGKHYKLPSEARVRISQEDFKRALDPKKEPDDERDIFVRDCFDSLFYYMAMLEHYTARKLIVEEDVKFPLDYYVSVLCTHADVIKRYLDEFGFERTQAYLQRHGSWRKAMSALGPSV